MKADVAVVGGGPAGAATALLLAGQGFEVALFDRATFPRPKVCGEFLNPGAVRILRDELGFEMPAEAERLTHVQVVPAEGPPLRVRLPEGEEGFSLRRIRTDAILLERARAAGVRVYEGHSVETVENGIAGRGFRCSARLVIAADGTHSRAARERGLVRPIDRLRGIGLVAHFAGLFDEQSDVRMFGARDNHPGVAGFSRQGEGRAVFSGVLPLGCAKELSRDRFAFVERWARGLGLPEARLEEILTTSCFGHRLRREWDDGILFVGDAACFIDPFTGEGVHHALEGAVAAARTAGDHLRYGRPLAQYMELRQGLRRRYVVCDVVRALVHRPVLLNLIATNLRRRPRAAERLIGELVDLLPPGGALSARMLADALIPSLS